MKLKEFQKDLELLVNQHSLDSQFNLPDFGIADYIMDCLNALMKVNRLKPQSDGVDDFIERMYNLYPNKCPKRGTSLGKTRKDKERIRKLLKTYSMEEIEMVFKHEIDTKLGKTYMQNFSTFLNNFPDPLSIDSGNLFSSIEEPKISGKEDFVINGVTYR